MGFVQVIFAIVYQVHIVSRQIHSQGNVSVVGGIIIHQRNKQAAHINKSQQCEEKSVNTVWQETFIQYVSLRKVKEE